MAFNGDNEKVEKELEPIKKGFKTRVISTARGKVVDVREFIETDKYTGFTKKGLRLNKEELIQALTVLAQAKDEL